MERAAAIANSHNIYRLIRNTSLRKPSVIDVIKYSDGKLFHFQERRMVNRAEQFRGQLSYPITTVGRPAMLVSEKMHVNSSSPTEKISQQ